MAQPTYTKVGSADEHRGHTKDFLKLMGEVARREGIRESDAFGRWLTMATSALANAALQGDQARWDRNEARYMDEVGRFREKRATAADMAEALAICTDALEAAPTDFLGPIFMELSAHSGAGQFFTPWHVSEAIARMILSDAPGLLAKAREQGRGFLLLSEPACGAGGMALAANQVLREAGLDPARHAHWHAVDLDWRCCCCSYIQLSLTASSAIIYHGNTLSMEIYEALPTIMARMRPKRERPAVLGHANEPAEIPVKPKVKGDAKMPKPLQLDMFADIA